ncbi:hypothetical protein [Thomasclavelia ramosa]|uniref:hypothetical protein n=1 Tax=Thomasclavelia ramosa TaxID=1547 RepID=UPI0022E3084F|nr:hypothetical protein [Thomasclavelia ramosa]
MAKYLDSDGVLYLWNKIKSAFVKKESGKGLSTNDFTTALMNKLNGIASGANNYVHPSYTSRASGLYKIVVDATGHISQVAAVTKADITALGIPAQDTNYANMTGATASVAGKAGLVPAPAAGKQLSFLRGDGTWVVPTDTKITVDTTMSATSTNPVQNKVITAYLGDMEDDLTAKINAVLPEPSTQVSNNPYFLQVKVSGSTSAPTIDMNWAIPDVATSNHNGFMSAEMASKLNEFQNASAYALKSDIVGMYKYKGSVANSSNLPTSGQTKGDVYNIVNASSYGPAGTNVAWDGSAWDALGGLFEIESITNAEIDAICV